MKNKLLLSSALVSGLAIAGSTAFADTTIKGGMTLAYKAVSNTAAGTSASGYGRETQIDVKNSGELSNGMKYAAGFSLEQDGTEGAFDGGENVYIDVSLSDATTFSFGQDHMANLSATAVPKVGKMFGTAANGVTGLAYKNEPGVGISGNFGLGIVQKLGDAGTATINYVPNVGDAGGKDSVAGDGTRGNAGYDVTLTGSLGVEGLNVRLAYKSIDGSDDSPLTDAQQDVKATQIGASYSFGDITVGYNRNSDETNDVGVAGTADDKQKVDEFGLAYKVSDSLSVGIGYVQTEITTDGAKLANDEEILDISVGYNLGPVAVVLQYADVSDAGGTAGSDGEVLALRLSTAF